MIYIQYTYLSSDFQRHSFDKYLALQPVPLQQKILRFRRWQDAQATLMGRLLLKRGCADHFHFNRVDTEIIYNEFQKPYFRNVKLDFNISHSGNIIVCVIAPKRSIGIDVEKIMSIDLQPFKAQMTRSEWTTVLQSPDQDKAFYRYWTQKEAVVKAYGKGLSVPLSSFEILQEQSFLDDDLWYTREVLIDRYYYCHLAADYPLWKEEIQLTRQYF